MNSPHSQLTERLMARMRGDTRGLTLPPPVFVSMRGEFLEFMKTILLCDAAKQRGLYNPAYVEKLMAEPEAYLTKLQGSKLWHLAALELWLQQNVDSL